MGDYTYARIENAEWLIQTTSDGDSQAYTSSVSASNGTVTLDAGTTLKVDIGNIKDTYAEIGTLNLADGAKVDGSCPPLSPLGSVTSRTVMVIGAVNMREGATGSIVGANTTLGSVAAAENANAVLNVTSYGDVTLNGFAVSGGATVKFTEKTNFIVAADSTVTASSVEFSGLRSLTLDAALQMDGYDGLNLGAVTGSSSLTLGDGGNTVDTRVSATSFTGSLHVQSDAEYTVTGVTTLVGESVNSGVLVTDSLTHSGNASLVGAGSLTVNEATTLESGSAFTLANSKNLALGVVTGSGTLVLGDAAGSADTAATATSFEGVLNIKSDASFSVSGTTTLAAGSTIDGSFTVANSTADLGALSGSGRLYLGDSGLTDGASDTYACTSGLGGTSVTVRSDAVLELAEGSQVNGTLTIHGGLQGTSVELGENGKIVVYNNNLDASGLNITGQGVIQMGATTSAQTVNFGSYTASVSVNSSKQTLYADSATLIGESTVAYGTLSAQTLTLAENAELKLTGKLKAAEVVMKEGSWLDWRSVGTFESAAVTTSGEGGETVSAPALITMEHGSKLSFLHEVETNPTSVTLNADVKGNGQVGIGYFSFPAGATTTHSINVTIDGVLHAGDSLSKETYSGLAVWMESVLTVGTGDWVKGQDSLVLSGYSAIDGNATVNMKYGRLKLTEGATLKVAGTLNFMELAEGDTDDSYRTAYLDRGSELLITSTGLTSLKSVDGFGNLHLREEAANTFVVEQDFAGSFTLEDGRNLTVGGTTTLNGDSTGSYSSGKASVLTTGTLANNEDASLSKVEVQASKTVLAAGTTLTVTSTESLVLGEMSGTGTLALESASASKTTAASATAVDGTHVMVGDNSTFTLSSDAGTQNLLNASGAGTVVLGDGTKPESVDYDTLVTSNSFSASTLNILGDARLTLADGTAFALGTVTNEGALVLGNGELTEGAIDTVVTMTDVKEIGQLQILQDASLTLADGGVLKGEIANDGAIICTTMTAAADLTLTGTGSLDSDSLTINEGVTLSLNGTATIDSYNNQGILTLGNGQLTDGKRDTVLDLSGSASPYTIQSGNLQIGSDAVLKTGENVLVFANATSIAGGLIAGEVQMAEGAGLIVEQGGEMSASKLVMNGELTAKGQVEADVLTYTAASTITGTGSVRFGEIQANPDFDSTGTITLTVKNITSVDMGKVYGPTLGRGKLVLGDGASDGGFDTVVTADSVALYSFYVNSDAKLTTEFLSLNGMGSSRNFTINGEVVTDYIAPWFDGGSLALNADDFQKLTVNKGAKLYGNTSLTLKGVNLAFESVDQMDTNEGWGTLILGNVTPLDGNVNTTLTVSGVFDSKVEVRADAALTIGADTANLMGGKVYGTLTAKNLQLYDTTQGKNPKFVLDGSLTGANLVLNEGVSLSGSGYLDLSGTLSMAKGAELKLTGGRAMTLKLEGSEGSLVLGDANADVQTKVTVDAFTGKLDIKSDAELTVEGETTLNRDSTLDGSLTGTNLNLTGGVALSGAGYLDLSGKVSMAKDSKLKLTGGREMTLELESSEATLALGDGDADVLTKVTVDTFTGMLDIKSDASLTVESSTSLIGTSILDGNLKSSDLILNEGASLSGAGYLDLSGDDTRGNISMAAGSRLELTGGKEMQFDTIGSEGTLALGDGDDAITTKVTAATLTGMVDIKSDASLTVEGTTTLIGESKLDGSLVTQNLFIDGPVNLSGAGTLEVKEATTLAKDRSLTIWGSENIILGAVSGTGGSSLALGDIGSAPTSATATSFNCSQLSLAGQTTFTVTGDFNAPVVDMGPEAGATLHVQNGTVTLDEIGNASGLQTGTLVLGDGERRSYTEPGEKEGETITRTEADTIATVNNLNLTKLELKSDATLSMAGSGEFKTGEIMMEADALLDLNCTAPIELGAVSGSGRLVLGAANKATATAFEGALDIGSGASMTVGTVNEGTMILNGESTNSGTLMARRLILKNGGHLSGDGYLVNVNDIDMEYGARIDLTNSMRPDGYVVGGYDNDTLSLGSISGKGVLYMSKWKEGEGEEETTHAAKVLVDSFEGCLGMLSGTQLKVNNGTARLNGVGASYGTLITRQLIIAEKSGFETRYKNAIPTSYDFNGDGTNEALTLTLEYGSYLHMYETSMQDFLDSMTEDSITLMENSVFYGQGNLHIDQVILDKFYQLDGKIQVSGIITYDSNIILTGCEGLFEGGVSDPSTAEVFNGDVSGDPSTGELPEAQEVPNDVADEIVQEEIETGDVDTNPDTPDIDPGGDGGASAGEVISGIADAAAITGGAAGIVATGLKTYGKVKAAKYAAAAAIIGIAGGTITEIVLALTDDDEGDDDPDDEAISIIEDDGSLSVINTSIVTGNSKVLTSVAKKTKDLKDSGAVKDYEVKLEGNTEVEIKDQLAAWFPEFGELEEGEVCFSSPATTLTGTVVLSGSDITFKGYSAEDEKNKVFNYDRQGSKLVFNKGGESRTTKVVSKETLRMRAADIDVLEGSILGAKDVNVLADTLEVSGGSYVLSTEKSTLKVATATTVDEATLYLSGLTDGSKLGDLTETKGARVVLDGSGSGTNVSAKSVSLDNSNLTVKEMSAAVSGTTTVSNGSKLTVTDATYSTSSMNVESGSTLVNKDGTISSASGITVNGGTVQGSGTFSAITLNSGKLVVGNSPGLQVFTGDLVLGDAEMLFSVGDFETVAGVGTAGWDANVYSSVDMQGKNFTLTSDSVITLAFGAGALDTLSAVSQGGALTFSFTLLQNVGNVDFFTEEMLATMLGQTRFIITTEAEGLVKWDDSLAGTDFTKYTSGMSYKLEAGEQEGTCKVVLTGKLGRVDVVPEPATTTLSLLALAALAARRRRK